jgi:hypothetical protein
MAQLTICAKMGQTQWQPFGSERLADRRLPAEDSEGAMIKHHRLILIWISIYALSAAIPLMAVFKEPVKTQSGLVSGVSGTDPSAPILRPVGGLLRQDWEGNLLAQSALWHFRRGNVRP